jgi:hypothetical protein
MAYKIKGEYVTTCTCQLICPCGVDGPPTGKDGKCRGVFVLHITEGNANGTDLAGVDVAMVFILPGNVTSGNWTAGLVFDPKTPDDKVAAVEKILKGEDGGPFGEFAPLIGEFKASERAPVTYTPGKEASATIGKSSVGFSPHVGADGNPTLVRNAMFGFAPEYEIGKGSGKVEAAGISFESVYGEHAQFEYAS